MVDSRDEKSPVTIGTLPIPAAEEFAERGGRFGAHNLHENYPLPTSLAVDDLVFGAFFNAGVRAYDIVESFPAQGNRWYIRSGAPSSRVKGARSTTCSSTIAASCSASIAMSAGSTRSKCRSEK